MIAKVGFTRKETVNTSLAYCEVRHAARKSISNSPEKAHHIATVEANLLPEFREKYEMY